MAACDVPPRPPSEGEGPSIVASTPMDGEEAVPRRRPMVINVDRPLLPRTVNRASVALESGITSPFLSVRFDVVERAIIATTFTTSALEPDVVYRLIVSEDVRDLDDRPLVEPFEIAFRTSVELGEPLLPRSATWAEVEPILRRSCTGAACHGPGPAALGLDLSSPEAVRATAIGVPSRQFPSGATGSEGASGTLALAGLRNIDVLAGSGRPETSYLVYKVLGDEHILGDPMPPPGDAAHPPLEYSELRVLADWILAGAPTL